MRLRADPLICGALFAAFLATPVTASDYEATGQASWYGDELRGRPTANGESFNPDGFTAAHRTLPMSSYVEVTALDTGKTILVRVNDRGPYHGNRIIDLSHGAARQLGMVGNGSRLVRVRRVDPSESEKLALRRGNAVQVRANIGGADLQQLRDRNRWSAPQSAGLTMPAGAGPYYIRVGTFSGRTRAEAMASRLGAGIMEADGLYQVRLGPFADANKVKAALAPLAAKGYSDVRIVR